MPIMSVRWIFENMGMLETKQNNKVYTTFMWQKFEMNSIQILNLSPENHVDFTQKHNRQIFPNTQGIGEGS